MARFASSEYASVAQLIAVAQNLYDDYYKVPYEKEPPKNASEQLKGEWENDLHAYFEVERPNHALAHSMRKAFLVPVVIKAYKEYGSEFNFTEDEIYNQLFQ